MSEDNTDNNIINNNPKADESIEAGKSSQKWFEQLKSTNKKKDFQILYEDTEKTENAGDFVPFITKEKPGKTVQSEKKKDVNGKKTEISEEFSQQVYKEGYDSGLIDGVESGKRDFGEAIDKLNDITRELEKTWQNMINKNEKEIIKLICAIAEKVVYSSAEINRDIVRESILHAFELIPNPVDVIISINREDYEYIDSVKSELFEDINKLKHVSVVSDQSVKKGGCIIKTKDGEVNTDIESRLEAIKKNIINPV